MSNSPMETLTSYGRLDEATSLAATSKRYISESTAKLRGAPLPGPDQSVDAALISILDAAPEPGETIALTYQRKERQLGQIFVGLDVLAAHAMRARLSDPREGDAVAIRFARLVPERRGRLLAFLADARRRAALRASR